MEKPNLPLVSLNILKIRMVKNFIGKQKNPVCKERLQREKMAYLNKELIRLQEKL
jgi:hypothetical protein